jgi:hypothetical protein
MTGACRRRAAWVVAVLGSAVAGGGWAWPRYGGQVVVEVPRPVRTTDPTQALDDVDVLAVGLTQKRLLVAQEGDLAPQLLAALPTSDGEGGVFTLRLRPGLRFADGLPLDAAALKGWLARLVSLRDSRAARVITAGLQVDRMETRDDVTLVLYLDPPDRAFPFRLALPAATPRSAVGAGTGSFHPEAQVGDDVVLGFNLWDPEGRPFLDRVVLRAPRSRLDRRQETVDVRCGQARRAPREEDGLAAERTLVLSSARDLPERQAWLRFLGAQPGLVSMREALGAVVVSPMERRSAVPSAREVVLAVDEGSALARLVAQRLQLMAHDGGKTLVLRALPPDALRASQETGEPWLTLSEVVAPVPDLVVTVALALPPDDAEALVVAAARSPDIPRLLDEQVGALPLLRVAWPCALPPSADAREAPGGDRTFTPTRRTLRDAVDGRGYLTLERAWWR